MSAAVVRIQTARFGRLETVEVSEDALVTLPDGLYGFEEQRKFALVEDPRFQPFRWLQALDDPYVRFVLIDPGLVDPGYEFDLPDQDARLLELQPDDAPQVLAIVTVRGEGAMTANLKAPLVVNHRRRLGKQVILSDDRYELRHPLPRPRPAGVEARQASCSS